MELGSNLFNARKKSGLSQEAAAEKLGVSRQTISKWETGETLPDIRQAKRLSVLYHLTLDELIAFDAEVEEIERVIENTSEAVEKKVDWTKVWARNTPSCSPIPRPCRSTITPSRCGSCCPACGGNTATARWMPAWCSRTFSPTSGSPAPEPAAGYAASLR